MDISRLAVPWRPSGWWGRTPPTNNKEKISSLFDVGLLDVVQLFYFLSLSQSLSGNEEFLEGRREMGMFMMKSLLRERERERSKC